MGDEAEAQLAHLSGGHHVPDWGPAEDLAPAAEEDAASMAAGLVTSVLAVLEKHEHGDCNLNSFATTTLHEGATVVVCGCGLFFPAPKLGAATQVLSPDRVDAHSPAAVTVAAADPIARTLALIGPAEDYTPEQVERLMLNTVQRIEEGQAFERWALEQASAAETRFTREYAKAFTLASGPMEMRRNVAITECADLMEQRDETAMVHKAARAAMHNLRSVLSGYQSVLRSVQATFTAGGSSGRPF